MESAVNRGMCLEGRVVCCRVCGCAVGCVGVL